MHNTLSRQKLQDLEFRLLRLLDAPRLQPTCHRPHTGEFSLGGVNYCLKALIGTGLVKVENFAAPRQKMDYMHVLTACGKAEWAALAQRFLQCKLAEYALICAEIEALQREVSGDCAGVGARIAVSAASAFESNTGPVRGVG